MYIPNIIHVRHVQEFELPFASANRATFCGKLQNAIQLRSIAFCELQEILCVRFQSQELLCGKIIGPQELLCAAKILLGK